MKKRGILFPFKNDKNQYINLMKDGYSFLDYEMVNLKTTLKKGYLLNRSCQFISLNWIEKDIIGKSKNRTFLKYCLVKIFIFVISIRVDIFWTMHNKRPHNSSEFSNKYAKRITDYLVKKSKYIIIHSELSRDFLVCDNLNEDTLNKKILYVPHPNYIGVYGDIQGSEVSTNKLKLLFVGQISQYKNVDLLIRSFSSLNLKNAQLTIMGKIDPLYKEYITKLIGDNQNIFLRDGFVPDSELPVVLAQHHLLITPYDLSSSLNSGTHLLSFSYSRTVLSPFIGTLQDMKDIEQYFFSYQYESNDEHEKILSENISKIYHEFSDNYDKLLDLGKECFDYVKENNNIGEVSKSLKKALDTVL